MDMVDVFPAAAIYYYSGIQTTTHLKGKEMLEMGLSVTTRRLTINFNIQLGEAHHGEMKKKDFYFPLQPLKTKLK
jgi:hypothetical protein